MKIEQKELLTRAAKNIKKFEDMTSLCVLKLMFLHNKLCINDSRAPSAIYNLKNRRV